MPKKPTCCFVARTPSASLPLEASVPLAIRSVSYWDEYAPWYKLWLEHTDYHHGLKDVLAGLVRPGWRVLDVGGGSGVLALTMARLGAEVAVVEPSEVMRGYLGEAAAEAGLSGIAIIAAPWEDIRPVDVAGFDLVVASNSLHLTGIGEARAFGKILDACPDRVLVASERILPLPRGEAGPQGYELAASGSFRAESSFWYHSVEEALRHLDLKDKHGQDHPAREDFVRSLVFRAGHFVHERWATVFWGLLRRTDEQACPGDPIR